MESGLQYPRWEQLPECRAWTKAIRCYSRVKYHSLETSLHLLPTSRVVLWVWCARLTWPFARRRPSVSSLRTMLLPNDSSIRSQTSIIVVLMRNTRLTSNSKRESRKLIYLPSCPLPPMFRRKTKRDLSPRTCEQKVWTMLRRYRALIRWSLKVQSNPTESRNQIQLLFKRPRLTERVLLIY